jgi:general secretion pathway protein D
MKKTGYALAFLFTALTALFAVNSIAEQHPTINNFLPPGQSAATPPPANIPPQQPATKRLWNLQDADILSVINEVSLETGKNFVVDPRVSGKISLISSKPIQPDEAYDVFLSVLELLGYSAIPSGNVVKIVPNMESTEMATRIASSNAPGKGDETVVRVIPLENVSATQILPVLRPMLPQWSNISAYSPGNVIILVGHAANLQRIVKVIQNIDSSSSSSIEVVPLHQASASQLAMVLNNLQTSSKANGENSSVSIATDERSNSILLGGNKAARLHMRTLIAQLDAPPAAGSQGNTEVIYLRYLQAKTLAPIMGKIAENILRTSGISTANTSSPAMANTPPDPAGKAPAPENSTSIQAESNTNALIITAPPALMKALKNIVAKLDIRPAQVLVQAIIVELDQADLNNMGIQWGSRNNLPNTVPQQVDTSSQGASSLVGFPPYGEGTLGIIPGTQIKAVMSLLENKTGVNILSTPSVVVLDNQKATLKVGKEVPDQTGSYATSGSTSTVTPFNTIGRKPVVLQLDVIPQINLGNAVRLKLKLQNDTLQNPDNPGLNPVINTSAITNSVLINSDDILVIGGLISNNITESIDKIPILGDVPVVGILFRHKVHQLEKKNLVAFIKPLILHDSFDSTVITNTKYNNIRQAQINWPENLTQVGEQKLQSILPPWNNNVVLPKPFDS